MTPFSKASIRSRPNFCSAAALLDAFLLWGVALKLESTFEVPVLQHTLNVGVKLWTSVGVGCLQRSVSGDWELVNAPQYDLQGLSEPQASLQ